MGFVVNLWQNERNPLSFILKQGVQPVFPSSSYQAIRGVFLKIGIKRAADSNQIIPEKIEPKLASISYKFN